MKALIRRNGAVTLEERGVASGIGEPGGAAKDDLAVRTDATVTVTVAFAGVCRTDLAVADGEIEVAEGRVLGHELSGWIDGQPVAVVPFTIGAGEARRWLGVDLDGAFADRVVVPAASVIRLPPTLRLELGAFVEPVAAALGVLAVVERGMRVMIGGSNRIAELTARVVAAAGAVRVPRGPCDVAIEHDGDATSLIAQLRAGGTLILKSRAHRSVALPAGELVARELIVRGLSHGSFATAVDWLHTRRLLVDDLLAPPRPLSDFAAVFAAARNETQKQMFVLDR